MKQVIINVIIIIVIIIIIITGSKLTSPDGSEVDALSAEKIKLRMVLNGIPHTAELNSEDELKCSDGDVWQKGARQGLHEAGQQLLLIVN
jgi:hypothetical protein